jgi:hypothetical protein
MDNNNVLPQQQPNMDNDMDGVLAPAPGAGVGGRRHKGSKKMHKGKRHGNASLRAWVTFVKKVQKEEGINYKEAMTRAKQRKDKGEKWRGGGLEDEDDMSGMMGGRRRRRTKRAHRRTRSHRRSRRHH